VKNFGVCRPKRDIVEFEREAKSLQGEIVSMSNSSDPYPRVETNVGWTRKCLDILARNNCRIQIITKSNIVVRDTDLLSTSRATVAFTVTTDDEGLASILEPLAVSPDSRLSAAQELCSKDVPVSARIDPIIPFLNEDQRNLIRDLANIGVKHITSSTYKPKPDNWKRLSTTLPDLARKLAPFYFREGVKTGGTTLLPMELRVRILSNIRKLAIQNGMTFGVCRENLPELNTALCDGSSLIPSNLG
jgi:DNA repair photolyase